MCRDRNLRWTRLYRHGVRVGELVAAVSRRHSKGQGPGAHGPDAVVDRRSTRLLRGRACAAIRDGVARDWAGAIAGCGPAVRLDPTVRHSEARLVSRRVLGHGDRAATDRETRVHAGDVIPAAVCGAPPRLVAD